MLASKKILAVIPFLVSAVAGRAMGEADPAGANAPQVEPRAAAATSVVDGVDDSTLRQLLTDVLLSNPALQAAAAQARGAAQRGPQVKALPDPVATVTAFLETPETRTGPQRFALGLSQGLPWLGKLALREQAAILGTAVLEAEVEARRLMLVTETRRLFHELAFVARQREITEEYRAHLGKHEEIARSRYATGSGLGQAVIRLQAEITRRDSELLALDHRRVALSAQLNLLRARPADAEFATPRLLPAGPVEVALEALLAEALAMRPELVGADARIAQSTALIRLAEKGYRPDFTIGLTYTLVDPRADAPGRAMPPPGNGDDILGVQAGITLPVRRTRLAAAVTEATEMKTAATERRREVVAAIEASVGDLVQRVPLNWRQLRLLEDLLIVQAEEALDSAQAGYIAGALNALDLLDAEHVLFQAHTATARALADYLISVAQLEGAVGRPLQPIATREPSDS